MTPLKKQKMMKEKVAEELNTENLRTSKFYLRPKIHKRGIPGRPVVSSVNCHIWKYVHYHLQPIVKEIPSYVKETRDFIQKLNQIEEVPEGNLLVTLDVKSLYATLHSKQQKNKSNQERSW